MLKGVNKKFFIFICLVLAMFATLGMTPETKRKQYLAPITRLYSDKSDENSNNEMVAESNTPKFMVKPDNAEKSLLNVEPDPEHPDQLVPVTNAENKIVDDTEDSSLSDEKLETILDEAPL